MISPVVWKTLLHPPIQNCTLSQCIESFWGTIQGATSPAAAPVMATSVTPAVFLNQSVPQLLHWLYHFKTGFDVCQNIRKSGQYRPITAVDLTLMSLMEKEDDIKPLDGCDLSDSTVFFANTSIAIGIDITNDRIDDWTAAIEGSTTRHSTNEVWCDPSSIWEAATSLCRVRLCNESINSSLHAKLAHPWGFWCDCFQFKNSGQCRSSLFVAENTGKLEPCLGERMHNIYVRRNQATPGMQRRKRKRSWVRSKMFPSVSSRPFSDALQSLGVAECDTLPDNLLYLSHRSRKHLRLVRLARGIKVPAEYYGRLDEGSSQYTMAEELEACIAGTKVGRAVLSLQEEEGGTAVGRFTELHSLISSPNRLSRGLLYSDLREIDGFETEISDFVNFREVVQDSDVDTDGDHPPRASTAVAQTLHIAEVGNDEDTDETTLVAEIDKEENYSDSRTEGYDPFLAFNKMALVVGDVIPRDIIRDAMLDPYSENACIPYSLGSHWDNSLYGADHSLFCFWAVHCCIALPQEERDGKDPRCVEDTRLFFDSGVYDFCEKYTYRSGGHTPESGDYLSFLRAFMVEEANPATFKITGDKWFPALTVACCSELNIGREPFSDIEGRHDKPRDSLEAFLWHKFVKPPCQSEVAGILILAGRYIAIIRADTDDSNGRGLTDYVYHVLSPVALPNPVSQADTHEIQWGGDEDKDIAVPYPNEDGDRLRIFGTTALWRLLKRMCCVANYPWLRDYFDSPRSQPDHTLQAAQGSMPESIERRPANLRNIALQRRWLHLHVYEREDHFQPGDGGDSRKSGEDTLGQRIFEKDRDDTSTRGRTFGGFWREQIAENLENATKRSRRRETYCWLRSK